MKHLFSSCIFAAFASAAPINYAIITDHAFLPERSGITLTYERINDTIDIFNIKESELGGLRSDYAAIGNMIGYTIAGFFAPYPTFASFQERHIQYGAGTLKNRTYTLFYRFKLLENEFTRRAVALDIGYRANRGEDMHYDDVKLVSSLASKLAGRKLDLKKVQVDLTNLKDDTLTLTLRAEKRFDPWLVSAMAGYRYTQISSTVTAAAVEKDGALFFKKAKLDRNERSASIGFGISYISSFIIEGTYRFDRFFRSSGLGYVNYNHTLKLYVGYPMSRDLLFFVGGEAKYRQFNGDISYLYNRYTQTTFDHKYGYAQVGFSYRF